MDIALFKLKSNSLSPSHSVGSHVDCYKATAQKRCHPDLNTAVAFIWKT